MHILLIKWKWVWKLQFWSKTAKNILFSVIILWVKNNRVSVRERASESKSEGMKKGEGEGEGEGEWMRISNSIEIVYV